MGLFNKTVIPQENQIAVGELLKRATETPTVATKKIAGLSPLEQTTERLAGEFVTSGPSAERTTAMKQATEFAKGGDVTQLPELQAVMDRILGEGERSGRGLARALKLTGNDPARTAKGRDIIGRAFTDVQGRLMEAAAPFLESERNRQFQAIPLIDQLAQAETNEKLQKLGVGERVGAMTRNIQQMINDAEYNRSMEELQLRYQIQPQLLSSVANLRAPTVQQGTLSKISQVANTVSDVASAATDMRQAGAAWGSSDEDLIKMAAGR